jgi:hypothetical protein
LSGREQGKTSGERIAFVGRGESVSGRRSSSREPSGPAEAAQPAAEPIHRRSVQVTGRVIHRPYPIPPLPQGEKGLLRELFRLVRVAGEHEQRPKKALVLGFEELLETQR